jgi:hypothetical protein
MGRPDAIEAMTLRNMRENGVRSLLVYCTAGTGETRIQIIPAASVLPNLTKSGRLAQHPFQVRFKKWLADERQPFRRGIAARHKDYLQTGPNLLSAFGENVPRQPRHLYISYQC